VCRGAAFWDVGLPVVRSALENLRRESVADVQNRDTIFTCEQNA
jgi:hypothetical protein